MGHNHPCKGRTSPEIIDCVDATKTQAKSTNVTADVTPDVTANVTGGSEPAEAVQAHKSVDYACGMTPQFDAGPQTGVADVANLEQDLRGGGFAAPQTPPAREDAGLSNTGNAEAGEPLPGRTNRNTLAQPVDHRAPRRRASKGASRRRLSQGDLPPNLTRDRDAYVFQRRVPKSIFGSAAESTFTNKHPSRILRIRLGPMTPPEAKKRARHLNAFFDILVASMSMPVSAPMSTPMNSQTVSPEQPDPFDLLAREMRRLRDAFSSGAAPPLDPATAIYATHIRDIVRAERARKGGNNDNVVARHASLITANAFSRMQTFSTLMDQLKDDPGLLDQLGAMIGGRSQLASGLEDAAHADSSRQAHQFAGPAKHSDHDSAEHAQGRIRMRPLGHQDGEEAVNPGAASKPSGNATAPVRVPDNPDASATLIPEAMTAMPPAVPGAGPPVAPDGMPVAMTKTPLERTPASRVGRTTGTIAGLTPRNPIAPASSDQDAVANPDRSVQTMPAADLPRQEIASRVADLGSKPAALAIPDTSMSAAYATHYAFGGFGLSVAPVTTTSWQAPAPASAHDMLPQHLQSQHGPAHQGAAHHGPAHQIPSYQAHSYHQPGPAPTFSELADSYDERQRQRGATEKLLSKARLARATFIGLLGDRQITAYRPSDLQFYIDRMQYWPKNHIKRSPELRDVSLMDWPIAQIIEDNRDFKCEGISRKTLEDSYVAFVRAIIRDRRTELGFADPFRDMKIAWPLSSTSPRKRLPISTPTLNKVFVNGVESGYLEEAILPLMAYLTGRRIALLLHLRGEDFRQRDGVWIVHPQSHIRFEGKRIRVPYKTEASLRAFVLHNVLDEIGFSLWASEQKGPIFGNALRYPDPSKLASRRLNRLLQRSGAIGENIEVLHSLRHQAIERMRHVKLDDKSRYLQAGHRGAWTEHDDYGAENLSGENLHIVANMPLDEGLDLSPFRRLDFDKMSQAVRTIGRRPG